MTTINRQTFKQTIARGSLFGAVLVCSSWVNALRFEPTDEIKIDLDTTVSYGAMWRVEKQDKSRLTTSVPVDQWVRGATGQPSVIDQPYFVEAILINNSDDGNRNFEKGDQVSNRYSIISDFDLSYKNVGVFLRGRAFYDSVYFEETSWDGKYWDHYVRPGDGTFSGDATVDPCVTSSATTEICGYQGPETINNQVAGGNISDPSHFSQRAKDVHGADIGFLDAYVYGSFNIGDHNLDLRIGRQAISWGEALMLQGGIGFAQNRIDVSAATAPGQQLKEIFLPSGSVYGQIDLTESLTLEAYWQYEWQKSVLMASDSYFGFTDFLDSGIFLVNSELTTACGWGLDPTTTRNGTRDCDPFITTSPYVNAYAMSDSGDKEPDNPADQFGMALRMLLDNGSEAGVYFIRYHDRYPSFWASNKGAVLAAAGGSASGDSEGLNTQFYTVEYKEGIELYGLTYNTVIGDTQVGLELTYRKNQPVVPSCSIENLLKAYDQNPTVGANPDPSTFVTDCKDPAVPYMANKSFLGVDNGAGGWDLGGGTIDTFRDKLFSWPTEAEVWTYNIGTTMVVPPTPFWDTGIFVSEIGGWYVGSGFQDEDLRVSDIGSFTQRGVGVSAIFLPQYKNIWQGIDLTIPVFINYTIDGSFVYFNYTKGGLWFAVGVEAVYLSNTTFGITYNVYGGDHAWKDRDNVSLNIKYSF